MSKMHASDLIISAHNPIKIRVRGVLKSLDTGELSEKLVEGMLKVILTDAQLKRLQEAWDLDCCLEKKGVGRFRTNVLKHRLGYMGVFRYIPEGIPEPAELGLDKVIKDLMQNHQGLVLVTGPIRSGKTTTMASLVNMIAQVEKKHIITIEDPIEYVYPMGTSMVNQREVSTHTQSTASAMRAALREDPDIILVGEMRDLETMELAIGAAETGHLVLSTLQTKNAAKTIDRVVDAFPPKQVAQIRTLLSGSLKGVISQKLIPHIDGQNMVMASEILLANISLTKMIKEGKLSNSIGYADRKSAWYARA
ncbi:MAG: PilT/PilU family type 4a pilus ATPase [Bdellovibrionota bacterium]